ncbi:MAG: hypothetical protein LQ340_001703 [Diploschistes diacapsis]|nr:MAG: hypothetical protein LQ340_001703 [Diploschistes diacapsis]
MSSVSPVVETFDKAMMLAERDYTDMEPGFKGINFADPKTPTKEDAYWTVPTSPTSPTFPKTPGTPTTGPDSFVVSFVDQATYEEMMPTLSDDIANGLAQRNQAFANQGTDMWNAIVYAQEYYAAKEAEAEKKTQAGLKRARDTNDGSEKVEEEYNVEDGDGHDLGEYAALANLEPMNWEKFDRAVEMEPPRKKTKVAGKTGVKKSGAAGKEKAKAADSKAKGQREILLEHIVPEVSLGVEMKLADFPFYA